MKIKVLINNPRISIAIIFFGIFTVMILKYPEFLPQLNLIALLLTLVVLIWYAYDTHRIANQTIEDSLRPLILRSGFIESWDNIKFSIENRTLQGEPLKFTILKNIAKDISGHIIINRKKYKLLFANNISGKNIKDNLSDLEKKVLFYLYENYKAENKNLPQSIKSICKTLDVKNGEYFGTITNSQYIETSHDSLLLTNEGIRLMDSDKPMEYRFELNWGWMNTGTIINAIFQDDEYEETQEDNQIYLLYSDIEGNRYFTRENKNFSQNSGKLLT